MVKSRPMAMKPLAQASTGRHQMPMAMAIEEAKKEIQDCATQALAEPEEARASPLQTKQQRRRIKELERELRRKEKALAETAALLVLSKKVQAIFNKDKGEDE